MQFHKAPLSMKMARMPATQASWKGWCEDNEQILLAHFFHSLSRGACFDPNFLLPSLEGIVTVTFTVNTKLDFVVSTKDMQKISFQKQQLPLPRISSAHKSFNNKILKSLPWRPWDEILFQLSDCLSYFLILFLLLSHFELPRQAHYRVTLRCVRAHRNGNFLFKALIIVYLITRRTKFSSSPPQLTWSTTHSLPVVVRQMFIGFRPRLRRIHVLALMGFLLHIWLLSSQCSENSLPTSSHQRPGGGTKQWTLQLMYDNYIYLSPSNGAPTKTTKSEAEGANFRKIRRKFFSLLFCASASKVNICWWN